MTTRVLRAGYLLVGLALVAAGVLVFVNAGWYRGLEAASSVRLVDLFTGQRTFHEAGSSVFFIGLGGDHPAGLDVTAACSTASVAAVGLIVTGLLVGLARATVSRSLLAFAAAVGVVAFVNIGRLVLLGWSAGARGMDGWFEWVHVYGGSVVSMVAIALACGVYLNVIRRSSAGAHVRTR